MADLDAQLRDAEDAHLAPPPEVEVTCQLCGGKSSPRDPDPCLRCAGSGVEGKTCPCWTCSGKGSILRMNDCPVCEGLGTVTEELLKAKSNTQERDQRHIKTRRYERPPYPEQSVTASNSHAVLITELTNLRQQNWDLLAAVLDLVTAARNAASQPMTPEDRLRLLINASDRGAAAIAKAEGREVARG